MFGESPAFLLITYLPRTIFICIKSSNYCLSGQCCKLKASIVQFTLASLFQQLGAQLLIFSFHKLYPSIPYQYFSLFQYFFRIFPPFQYFSPLFQFFCRLSFHLFHTLTESSYFFNTFAGFAILLQYLFTFSIPFPTLQYFCSIFPLFQYFCRLSITCSP